MRIGAKVWRWVVLPALCASSISGPALAKADEPSSSHKIALKESAASAPAAAEKLTKGKVASRTKEEEVGIQWVSIPGGSFLMGSGKGNEGPAHRVTIKTFEVAKTKVTNKQYRACVAAGACTASAFYGKDFMGEDQPVVGVEWEQAKAFAEWVGGRLPSEAEWEYAARSAGRDREYPWGNEAPTCDKAVFRGCSKATMPVCSKPAGNTEQGLCDMAGNVWEWVEDWYHDSYKGAPTDGSAWETPPSSGRVNRGGSWDYFPANSRAAYRFNRNVRGRFNCTNGFRVARSALVQ